MVVCWSYLTSLWLNSTWAEMDFLYDLMMGLEVSDMGEKLLKLSKNRDRFLLWFDLADVC